MPFKETKEHLYNILSHHLICYDDTEGYAEDLGKFQKFVAKYEGKESAK